MNQITINPQDILRQVKLSGKLPEMVRSSLVQKSIAQTITELDIQNTPEQLQQFADQFRLMNGLNTAKDTNSWLASNGFSALDFEALIQFQLNCFKLSERLFKNKIKDYYLQNQLDYRGVVLYEVILEDEDLAIELYLSIRGNETGFFEVAHRYNSQEELRRQGGYQGILYRKDLAAEISAPVFSCQAPCLLKPIVTAKATHLIYVEEFIEPELNENTEMAIAGELFNQWLSGMIEQIDYQVELNGF